MQRHWHCSLTVHRLPQTRGRERLPGPCGGDFSELCASLRKKNLLPAITSPLKSVAAGRWPLSNSSSLRACNDLKPFSPTHPILCPGICTSATARLLGLTAMASTVVWV